MIVDEESAYLDALIGEAVEMAELDAKVLKVQPEPRHTRTLLEHAVEESYTALGRHQVTLMVQEPDRSRMVRCQAAEQGISPFDRKRRALFSAGQPDRASQPPRRGEARI